VNGYVEAVVARLWHERASGRLRSSGVLSPWLELPAVLHGKAKLPHLLARGITDAHCPLLASKCSADVPQNSSRRDYSLCPSGFTVRQNQPDPVRLLSVDIEEKSRHCRDAI
jgi:hypothetical protein